MPISAKDILVAAVGLVLAVIGGWYALAPYTRILAAGLVLVGLATIALGVTRGFIDSSPLTSVLSKLGMLAYVVGIPALLYGLYRFM